MTDIRPALGFERVSGRCGGRPTIRGTRVEPRHIRGLQQGGSTLDEIAADWSHISRADLEACLLADLEVLDWLPMH